MSTGAHPGRDHITWVGHGTVGIAMGGTRVSVDPVLRPRVLHLKRFEFDAKGVLRKRHDPVSFGPSLRLESEWLTPPPVRAPEPATKPGRPEDAADEADEDDEEQPPSMVDSSDDEEQEIPDLL